MFEPEGFLGDLTIPSFIVRQLQPEKHGLTEADLATAIAEVESQTQILGASFISVHVSDPEWTIVTSGLVRVDADGMLNELEVEFPEGSGSFWRLVRFEASTEVTPANLVLTFEDRIVANLRRLWGERWFSPGLTTRAQIVKALVDEANLKLHLNPQIKFVCPGLNRVEPVAESKQTTTAKANATTKANRGRGVHAGAGFKIKGQDPSAYQRSILNEAIGVAHELKAPQLAGEALVEALIAENDVSNAGEGVLQVIPSTAAGLGISSTDIKGCVAAFLNKGFGGQGGAIAYAKAHPNAPASEVAQAVQASGAGKATKGAANYGPYLDEAQVILHAYGGIGGESGGESDVGQLSRGTPQNPDEDSWDCITRLAQEVGWYAFTDGKNTLFYMDGPDLHRQKPSAYIEVPANKIVKETLDGQKVEESGVLIRPAMVTCDNTAVLYRATHKVKQRVQRKSKIAKPQTPSEIRLQMVCGIDEFRAGDVFVFRNSGPVGENGGRWIVSDATRETLRYPYTKFILVPPAEPLPEPKATETKVGEPGVEIPSGIPKPEREEYRKPPPQGPTGTATFQGVTVAKWTLPMLEYAQGHGWTGQITSGYRPYEESEHAKTQYPGGAIDFGGPVPNPNPNREAFFAACAGFAGLPLIPAQFKPYAAYPQGDGGHASGTGY
jgi:hypothetical protein